MNAVADIDLPVHDLHELLTIGVARCGGLLTAGERAVVDRMLQLEGPAGRLYARLTARVGSVHRVDSCQGPGVPDGEAAVAQLIDAGLADRLVPWPLRAQHSTAGELKAACRQLGLRVSGRKAQLVERVAPHTHWSDVRWVRIAHDGLIRRVHRWAALRRWPQRGAAVTARLGHVRWPEYGVTPGPALHPNRAHLLRWESLVAQLDELDAGALLAHLESETHWAPGRLDLRGSLVRRLVEQGRQLEREDPQAASALYDRLLATQHVRAGELAVRSARALELAGHPAQALAHLRTCRATAAPVSKVAIGRAGKRLARTCRASWPPSRPLRTPPERSLRLPRAQLDGPRPGYRADGQITTVEAAVQHTLAASGRRALHVEGGLWRTLFALLFAEVYFLPVPGALPARFLAGPLDLGTPAFVERRADAVASVLAAVRRGEAADRVRLSDERWRGFRLRGARWDIAPGDLQAVAAAMPPSALVAVLERLLQGRAASRGLPDLVVLPGPAVRIPDALPSKLGEGLLLAEVKGPGDTVRDAQAVWFDRLLGAGAPVELWNVAGV